MQKPRDDVDFFFPDTSRSQGGEKTGGALPSRLARQDSLDSLFKVIPFSVRSIPDTVAAGPWAWGSQLPLLPGLLPSHQTKTVQQVCTPRGEKRMEEMVEGEEAVESEEVVENEEAVESK